MAHTTVPHRFKLQLLPCAKHFMTTRLTGSVTISKCIEEIPLSIRSTTHTKILLNQRTH